MKNNLKSITVQNIIFPMVSNLTKRKFWHYYKTYSKNQWLSKEKIEAIQTIKLRKLIDHAYNNVPFYKELFDVNGIKPNDIVCAKDLVKIPVVSKKDLQKAGLSQTSAQNLDSFDYYKDSTSGSTGEPFQFYSETSERDISTAITLLGYQWAGYNIGQKMVSLWGYHDADFPTKVYKFLLSQKDISAFDIDTNFNKIIDLLRTYKPRLLVTYASSIVKLAKLCQINSVSVRIPSIITSAETLYPAHRELLERTFQADIYDRYGSRELGGVAQECASHKGLHVFDESFIVQYEDFAPGNQLKRLIITHLDRYPMPLIRYDTGDLGICSEKPCTCGRQSSLIERIDGRSTDFLKLKSGKLIPFLFFNYSFEQYGPFVKSFQIIQQSYAEILVRLVPTELFTEQTKESIIDKLSSEFEGEKIEIELCKEIRLGKNGKMITVISK